MLLLRRPHQQGKASYPPPGHQEVFWAATEAASGRVLGAAREGKAPEEEEDTSSDPGSRPDFDPPSSPDGGAGAAAASVTGAAAVGAAA